MPSTKTHLVSYDKGLIFQFILHELCTASHTLNEFYQTESHDTLKILCGSIRVFPWSTQEGVFAKLKNYCCLLAELNKKTDDFLVRYSENTWLLAHQIQDAYYDNKPLTPFIEKLNRTFNKLSKQVELHFTEYRKDENVIYFVIRNHKSIDSVFGLNFTHELIEELFPKGIQEAEAFLQQRFKKRGFNHLLPKITYELQRTCHPY